MLGLTKRQREVLDFINAHLAANNGVAPSYQEIAKGIGIVSKSGVHYFVHGLIERGAISGASAGHYVKKRSLAPAGPSDALVEQVLSMCRRSARTGKAWRPDAIRSQLAGVA